MNRWMKRRSRGIVGMMVATFASLTLVASAHASPIDDKHRKMGGDTGYLGPAREGEQWSGNSAYKRFLRYRRYKHGIIFWDTRNGNTEAFEVHGAIWYKYDQLGREHWGGPPTTDQHYTPDGWGAFNWFGGAGIFYNPKPGVGAHEVHGAILDRWGALGFENSVLGYPTTDEKSTRDGRGRFSDFDNGSIYWTPQTGAHAVNGVIRDKWTSIGSERSSLGYPTSGVYLVPWGSMQVRAQDFEGGRIIEFPRFGAVVFD